MSGASTQFEKELLALLKSYSKEEIEKWFEQTFLEPLQNQLTQDEKTPAEVIRQRAIQTKKITNWLLTNSHK